MEKNISNPHLRIFWQGREAQAGSLKSDFNNNVTISLREMRESNYWLRIIKSTIENIKILKSHFI